MKKIVVVTGTRADYGIYYPVLKAINAEETLDLHLLVTGMHLSPQFGNTVEQIRQDGFQISAQVDCLLQGSSHANMSRSIGLAIIGMTQALETIQPDVVVVLGDRGEMLAAAIVASHTNIPLVHLHGGEVTGTIDESVRHAISKLAHIHLVATEKSEERLIRLGEDPWRIQVVGAPRIETIMNTVLPNYEQTANKYNIHLKSKYVLFAYHPVTTQSTNLQMLARMLQVLLNQGYEIICIMPNSDAGSDALVDIYNQFVGNLGVHLITNFEPLDYLVMLKHAEILVGNSSSGIIEAASFNKPVINIGVRQGHRERSSNVIDIQEDDIELQMALEKAISPDFQKDISETKNVYAKENTSSLIVNILKNISWSEQLIQKTITY
ncbi:MULTISPECIES: UDP-N-acetylglucosamine 2-epimerase [Paenibacillus]|uniref:UDP-N-acetylglucosamine 2-epimerase n=1 Tax=Paenibacillus amylolyticus TaxID=1451 RepID=A0ABD8ARD4_PAEAM|nr:MULTISPECIES: UDP-N-acetylglucosamine 2-epimerase [unclassified Paenibacillus]MBD8840700.1 UDP-N-acetylglucosamine 2-epimerase (hydrolyzing) [Paenibacillus sp. CFBP 13594]QZN76543.1 UDP-N-acetylglucosamine 2-epimerase (hydrolyzing) [Paenibacillus sp. DR312]